MNKKKIHLFFALLLALTLLLTIEGKAQPLFPYEGQTTPKQGINAPIISHGFAVEKGYYGYIWKIYLEANDPDGDMVRIASVVDQVGYGHYPTDWIYLKPEYQKNFKGYIQWNTYSSKATYISEWTQITLKVSIIDKAGNESNVVVFPFTFESGIKDPYKYKLPSPFDQGDLSRLGYISIDLIDPTLDDGNDRLID